MTSERSDLTDADYAALADFRFLIRRFQAFSEERAGECGLTPQQHQALLAIRGAAAPVSVGFLAERLAIRPNSASELVSRLEAAGLIARHSSAQDARQALLAPTPRALALLADLSLTHREEIVRMRPALAALLAALEVGG